MQDTKRSKNLLALEPDYILFMDADMELDPNAIQHCIDSVEQSGAGAVLIREITPLLTIYTCESL